MDNDLVQKIAKDMADGNGCQLLRDVGWTKFTVEERGSMVLEAQKLIQASSAPGKPEISVFFGHGTHLTGNDPFFMRRETDEALTLEVSVQKPNWYYSWEIYKERTRPGGNKPGIQSL